MSRLAPRTRARIAAALKLGLAVGLIAVIAGVVDGREALRLLSRADPAWLAVAFAFLSLQTVLSAARWRMVAARLDHGFGLGWAVREYYLSQIVNQTLPGGMLGDAGRAVRARGPAGLGMAGLAVAVERVAGQLGMVALMLGGLAAAWAVPGGFAPPNWIAATVLAVGAGLVAAGLLLRLSGALPGSLGRGADILNWHLRRAALARDVLPAQVVLSLATAACNLLAFAACARAIGIALPPGAVAVLVPLVLFAMLIPITVSGWGLREGAAASLLPLAGITGAQGLAASVAFGLVFLAAVLPGLWPLLASRGAGQSAPGKAVPEAGMDRGKSPAKTARRL